jgi:hypothetical protein
MWPFTRKPKRFLFRYWDGGKWRRSDPLECQRKIFRDEEYRADVHGSLVDEGDEEATDITLRMIRRVFGIKSWSESGGGLTQIETLMLYRNFCEYLMGLKKNISPPPTWQPATGRTSSGSEIEITSDTSVSGSTSTEPRSAAPTASASP